MSTALNRLGPDERFLAALAYLGKRVRVATVQNGNHDTFTGHITSVPTLRHGTTGHVLVLRTDQTRPDKDLAFSLAQVVGITELDFYGQPIA